MPAYFEGNRKTYTINRVEKKEVSIIEQKLLVSLSYRHGFRLIYQKCNTVHLKFIRLQLLQCLHAPNAEN